jgi:hypothetical protein
MFAIPTHAARITKQLTPTNVDDQLHFFSIDVERIKDGKQDSRFRFALTVKAKYAGHPLSPRRSTELQVVDGKELIVSCGIEPSEGGGKVTYTFTVAAKYAENSKLGFYEDLSGPSDEPAGRYYWFYLNDFLERK